MKTPKPTVHADAELRWLQYQHGEIRLNRAEKAALFAALLGGSREAEKAEAAPPERSANEDWESASDSEEGV